MKLQWCGHCLEQIGVRPRCGLGRGGQGQEARVRLQREPGEWVAMPLAEDSRISFAGFRQN